MAGIYDMAMQGLQIAAQGRAEKKQRTLAELVGKAYGAQGAEREALLGQVVGMDPQAGFAAQGQFRQMDDDMRAQVARHAQVFASLPDEQKAAMYPQLAAEVRKVTGVQVPDVYDAKFLPMIQRLGGEQAGEGYTLAPGSRRFDANNQLVAESPFAPANLQLASVATGDGGTQQMQYNPRSGALSPLLSGGAAGVQDAIRNLAGQFGGQITSMVRTPEHNREVGGVPNSQHIRGTAGDVVIGDPQMRRAYMEAAKGMGLNVIDEGDHLHTQLPRGTQVAQNGPLGYTPPKSETKQPSALMEKLQLAQSMGATPDQLRNMVIGDTGGGKPSATMLRQANAAKQKLIDLNAIEHQLNLVDQAFAPLKDTYSAGLLQGYLPTEGGRKFDSAVSLLQGQVRKLTRTPGEGAMSDYETKLAQLANPSRNDYESVTAQQLQQLRDLVATMRQGYQAILEDNGGNSQNIGGQQSGKFTVGQIIEANGKKYRVTDVSDPNDPDVEEVR